MRIWTRAAVVAVILFVALSIVALAQEGEIVPIIDRLPEQVFLFGASGGAIVSLLLSILKYYRIVGQDGYIPTQAANFILSVVVATIAYILSGQGFWSALLSAFTAMVAASGIHETIGHGVQRMAEAVVGKS